MRISSRVKIGFGLVVLFAAGAVCGGFLSLRFTERHFVKMMDSETWAPAAIHGMDKDLQFTPEQREKARAILDETVEKVVGHFRSIGMEMVRSHRRINQLLTPEQQAKHNEGFDGFRRAMREKFKIHFPSDASVTNAPVGDAAPEN